MVPAVADVEVAFVVDADPAGVAEPRLEGGPVLVAGEAVAGNGAYFAAGRDFPDAVVPAVAKERLKNKFGANELL